MCQGAYFVQFQLSIRKQCCTTSRDLHMVENSLSGALEEIRCVNPLIKASQYALVGGI